MKLRALVVEDSAVMRNMLMHMLPLTGLAEFQFTEAENGAEAWAEYHPDRTDIIFVDWKMPKLSGIDFVRKVRASEHGKSVPIVMVTGSATVGNVQEALDEAGADVYVTKPYTIDALRRQLAHVIEALRRQREESPHAGPAALLGRLMGGAGRPVH